MSFTNPLDDFVVEDPRAMRALAHPIRLAILTRLQRRGPGTATLLAPHVDASPSVVSWHLRHLAEFGLVIAYDGGTDRRQRWWQAAKRGFRFAIPDDAAGQEAARMLRNQLRQAAAEQVSRWSRDVEPHLAGDWDKLAGSANTRVVVTAEEATEVQEQIEQLLARYVTRPDEDTPDGARSVRFLRFVMPAGEEGWDG